MAPLFSRWSPRLGPGVFWNAAFHVGASAVSRSYCAGAVTAILLHVPLSAALAWLAVRDGLLSVEAVVGLFALAGVVHTLEVGHNVFKRWQAGVCGLRG